eukprot:5877600-Karenia_brevis.AAC.1
MERLWQQIPACRMIALSGSARCEGMGKWKAFSVALKMWRERANANTMPPSSVSIVQFLFAMNVTLWQ